MDSFCCREGVAGSPRGQELAQELDVSEAPPPPPAPTPVGSREEPSSGVRRGAGRTGVKVRKASLNGY